LCCYGIADNLLRKLNIKFNNIKMKKPTNKHNMKLNAQNAADFMKSFSNANRLMILCLLIEKDMNVAEINLKVKISQSALSQHLIRMKRDGLLGSRKSRNQIYYFIKDKSAKEIINTLHKIYC
jgi:DNA-binding transcriptional ArsR family regulator